MNSPTPSAESGRRFIGLNLAPGIFPANMGTFYWACLTGILLSSFAPQLQPYLLREFLHIPQNEQGAISGQMSFWGEIAIILSVGVWGVLADKIGRRPIMVMAYVLLAIGTYLYPKSTDYQSLLLARLVFATGIGAFSVIIITLIADYVKDDSRGKATGYLGMANGLGAMVTVFILLRLPSYFQEQGLDPLAAGERTYHIVMVMTLITAVWMWFGLQKKEPAHTQSTDSFMTIARKGLVAAKDPGIALAYGAAFVARGNLAIVGTFFTLWLTNHGVSENMTTADAVKKAGMILGIAQSCALLSAPIFGILSDRISRVSALNITLVIAFFGYGGTYFVTDPFGADMILCAILIGMSEVGCVITSAVLITQQSPAASRGAVIGFFNLSGAVGILVASLAGALTFDVWRPAAPFILFGVLAGAILIWSLIVKDKIVPLEEN
jgi:MFS family permease